MITGIDLSMMKEIDRDLSKMNFTIGEIRSKEWIKQRLKNVYQKPGQKRPIESCDIIVTLPKSESSDPENVKKFMSAAYESLAAQYGKHDNIIGGWVHMDESQPHLHFAFLPISPRDSKQKRNFTEKLAVRDYWPKKTSLQEMHRTLQRDIDMAMGHHVDGINNGITKEQGGNKSITELKAESRKLQDHIEKYQGNLEELDRDLSVEPEKSIFGGEEHYKLTGHQYKRLRTLAKVAINQSSEYERMKSENVRLENENLDMKSRMQRYLVQVRDEIEEEYRPKIEELEKERERRLKIEKEAAPFLIIPPFLRPFVESYIEKARMKYQDVVSQTMRKAVSIMQSEDKAASVYDAFQDELRVIDGGEWSRAKWLDTLRAMFREANRQIGRKTAPKPVEGWDMPKPSQVNFTDLRAGIGAQRTPRKEKEWSR